VVRQYSGEIKNKAGSESKSFNLNRCSLLEFTERPFTFTIVDDRNDKNSITLSASNQDEYSAWVNELIEAKANLTKSNEINVYNMHHDGVETEDMKILLPLVEGEYIGQFFRQYDLNDDSSNDDPIIDVNLLTSLILGLDDHMNINCGKYIIQDMKSDRIQSISLSEFMKWWLAYKSDILTQYDTNHHSSMQYILSDSIYFTGMFSSHILKQRTNIASLLQIRVPTLAEIVSDWEFTHLTPDWNAQYQILIDEICNIEKAAFLKHVIDLESLQAESQLEGFQTMRITSALSFFKFLGDFSSTAMKCCEVIIDEYSLPDELKTIKKLVDNNHEDEMYSYDDFLIRIAAVPGVEQDATPTAERHTEIIVDDLHNRKCTGLAFHSSQYLQQVVLDLKGPADDSLPRPQIDLMATVDYCGYRIEIHVPLREDIGVLVHGKNDETNTVVSDSEIIHELLQKIANKMKMEMFHRDVSITSFAKKPASFICPNLKVYRNRTTEDYYFTHTDVLLPQDLLQASDAKDSVDAIELDTRKLRPELLNYLPSTSSVTSHVCRDDAKDQNELNQIAKSLESLHYLYAVHLPETASLLDNASIMILDSYSITKFLHDRGINCRMMGILYSLSKVTAVKKALLCESVARSCKSILFSALRQCSRRGKSEANTMVLSKENVEAQDVIDHQVNILDDKKKIVRDFFNLVLGSGNQSKGFWHELLADEILKKFNINLRSILSFEPNKASLHLPQLFLALQYHTGVICTNYQKVALNFSESEEPLACDDFKNYFTIDAMLPMSCPGVCGKVASLGEALLGCGFYEDAVYSFRLRISSYMLAGNYMNSPQFTTKVGHSIYLLALSHYLNGQYNESIDALKSYMDIYENDSPLLCRMISLLMSIKFSMGQVDEAMAIFERGVDMYTFCFGPDHPIFCVHFCTLADLYFKEGAYAQAKVMLLLAFETCARILGDDHIITTAYRTKLAALYMKEETFKRSEEILSTNANICTSLLSKKVKFHNEAVEIYFGLASSLAKNGAQDEALKLLIKVKEMCKSRGDKINHDLYLSSIFLLSDIYNSNVRSTESQKELEDAWGMLQQNKDLKITSFALVKITCQMLSCYISTLDLQVRLMLETVEKEVDSDLIPFMNIKLWDEACLRVVSSLWTHKPNEFVETIIKKYHSFDVMNDESKKELLTSESLPNDTGISLALQIAVISKLIKNSNTWLQSNKSNQ